MKIYRQVTAVCAAVVLIGSTLSYGGDGGTQAMTPPEHGGEDTAYHYRIYAELGDARAQITLGMMYANGRGVQKDFGEAIYWLRQAAWMAQLSWHDAEVAEAVSWLQEAAGHGYTPAQRMLGLIEIGGTASGHIFCVGNAACQDGSIKQDFPSLHARDAMAGAALLPKTSHGDAA